MIIPKGFLFSGVYGGIKKVNKNDIGLVLFENEVTASGLFTKNRVKSPSVTYTKKVLKKGVRALLVVSGNANACVKDGMKDIKEITIELGRKINVKPEQIAFASTGVIGVKMPVEKIKKGFDRLTKSLQNQSYSDFHLAMQTTDAFDKLTEKSFKIDDKKINLLVLGKGAGMIAPNMATMLIFVFTDACISQEALDRALKEAVDNSFNVISVDGDTSTNDMVLAFASGMAKNKEIKTDSIDYQKFYKNLATACVDVAKQIVRDGEGATKVIELRLKGARNKKEALKILKTIANSQLVKTAFFGNDPNWGRILAAIGRSEVAIKDEKIDIHIAGMPVVRGGIEADGFSEKKLKEKMSAKELTVDINLNMGDAGAVFYTSDLTIDYVKLNSAYRT